MALILSIETATQKCSVALHDSGELQASFELNESGAHAERIMGLVDSVLNKAGCKMKDLSAVAVSEGPGSYTGLRIGVSTAKGICYALNIPLIAVNTLQSLAYQLGDLPTSSSIISMLDARRMEVYAQPFDHSGRIKGALKSEVLNDESFQSYLDKGKVYFVGDAVAKARNLIQHENAVFKENQPSAESVGIIAWEKFKLSDFVNLAYFVPNYLKEFKALHSKKNPLLA